MLCTFPLCAGLAALHVAVQNTDLRAAALLVEHGANVNLKDGKTGRSPLYLAVEQNDMDMVKYLLQANASIAIATYARTTPVQLAASKLPGSEISQILMSWDAFNVTRQEGKQVGVRSIAVVQFF